MPKAFCQDCKRLIHWRNQRGVKLIDYRCECGGKLSKAHFDLERQKYIAMTKVEFDKTLNEKNGRYDFNLVTDTLWTGDSK